VRTTKHRSFLVACTLCARRRAKDWEAIASTLRRNVDVALTL
jgi:hypothetical protein